MEDNIPDRLDVLNSFKLLIKYLRKHEKNMDYEVYEKDISAFLLHARHLKSYDFVKDHCQSKIVLDIGCFIGYGEKRISNYTKKIVAIDNDLNALDFAKSFNNSSNTIFMKSDVKTIPFKENYFDIVLAFHLIEHIHLKNIENFLKEINRILKKDGLFFVITPNRKTRLRIFQKPFNEEHYQEFSAKELKKILGNIFQNIEIMGIRSEEWVENIEKKRISRTFIQFYIIDNIKRILRKFHGLKNNYFVKRMVRKNKVNNQRKISNDNKYIFDDLFSKFSMDCFYLERRKKLLDKSMDLFAICKK